MTLGERVMSAINLPWPDRTPADYKAEPEVDEMMAKRLGVSIYDGLLERLEIDVRRIEPRYVGPPVKQLGDGVFEDYWGMRSKRAATSHNIQPDTSAENILAMYDPSLRDGGSRAEGTCQRS